MKLVKENNSILKCTVKKHQNTTCSFSTTSDYLLLQTFMQFALIFSEISLAYFINLFLLIYVHGHTVLPFYNFTPITLSMLTCRRARTLPWPYIHCSFNNVGLRVTMCCPFSHVFVIFCILYRSGLNIFLCYIWYITPGHMLSLLNFQFPSSDFT